jgi:hypothetical protein
VDYTGILRMARFIKKGVNFSTCILLYST